MIFDHIAFRPLSSIRLSFAEESGVIAGSLGMIPTRRCTPALSLRPAWMNFVAPFSDSPNARRSSPSRPSSSRPFRPTTQPKRRVANDDDTQSPTAA